jgi:cytosine/adenosine deaminase-related metal-dependent hydrolase
MLLRARIVLPVARPPLEDGAVRISGGRIAAVGRWRDLLKHTHRHVHDLGEVILLPGLVNAHCHLDYTNMAGMIPPQKSFTDWIKLITTAKAEWEFADYRQSWLHGASMLLRTGTTTVADIEVVPDLLPEVWQATPLRVLSFLEMTGIRARRAPETVLREARDKIIGLPAARCQAGLSPHAPYSTLPELLRQTAVLAHKHRWRVTTHVAESQQEYDMIRHRRGEMFHWLRRNERDMSDCGLGSPVQLLERAKLLRPNLLAVHANYLGPGDAELFAKHGVSVAHCPRSHCYFRHRPFPLRRLLRCGVNVCLGTDSLATVRKRPRQQVELNLFSEMQELACREPWLRPARILEMATRNAARALGLAGRAGELTKGAFADLIAIASRASKANVAEAVLQHQGRVTASMIDGHWASVSNLR